MSAPMFYLPGGYSSDSDKLSGLFVTLVLLLRDLHVQARSLSWTSMPDSQRRLVYNDLIRQILGNFPEDPNAGQLFRERWIEESIEKFIVLGR